MSSVYLLPDTAPNRILAVGWPSIIYTINTGLGWIINEFTLPGSYDYFHSRYALMNPYTQDNRSEFSNSTQSGDKKGELYLFGQNEGLPNSLKIIKYKFQKHDEQLKLNSDWIVKERLFQKQMFIYNTKYDNESCGTNKVLTYDFLDSRIILPSGQESLNTAERAMNYIGSQTISGISLFDNFIFKIFFRAKCNGATLFESSQIFNLLVISDLRVDLINDQLFIGTPSPLIIVQFSWADPNFSIVDSAYGKNLEKIPGINIFKYVMFGPTELISDEIKKVYYSRFSSFPETTPVQIVVSDPIKQASISKPSTLTAILK